jgi:ABC-type multidrug transport system ATPase subunit
MKATVSVTELKLQRTPLFTLHVPRLRISPGQILCITGPNGCGKTTLLEVIVGLLSPTMGQVLIHGIPVDRNLRRTKAKIGFVPDNEDWLIKELCAKEYFTLLQKVYQQAGVTTDMSARANTLAASLQFHRFLQPLGTLSHGNKKKVQIIAALMHRPPVIVVDEIRNGLDPLAIIEVEQLLSTEAKQGTTVVAATHDLWWAQRVSQEVLLLVDGEVVAIKDTAELIAAHGDLEHFFIQTVGA